MTPHSSTVRTQMVSFEFVSPLCANSSTSGKRNRVVLLAVVVLCGVLAGCNRSAGQPPASQQAQPPPLAAALPDSARPLLGWLPADNGIPGWLRAGQPRHFGPGTLWAVSYTHLRAHETDS